MKGNTPNTFAAVPNGLLVKSSGPSLIGGAGNDTLIQNSSPKIGPSPNVTIVGAGGNDLINIPAAIGIGFTGSIDGDGGVGSGGVDTLQILSASAVTDDFLSRVKNIEYLQTPSTQVTLGTLASGISTLASGANGLSVNASSYGSALTVDNSANKKAGSTIVGASSRSTKVIFANDAVLKKSSVVGGSSQDTLVVLGGKNLTDANFSSGNVRGFEALALGDALSATLGYAAQSLSGISDVIAGAKPVTIDVRSFQYPVTLDASAFSGATLVKGSSVRSTAGDTLLGSTLSGTTFLVSGADALASSSIVAGTSANDILAVTAATSIKDDFKKVIGVEVLSLSPGTAATLGTAANSSGFHSVIGGAGSVTVDASADTLSLTLDGSQNTTSLGNYFAGSSRTATNFILNGSVLSISTVIGGAASDTLQVLGGTIGDTFKMVSGVEVLSLNGSAATLGYNAQASGIRTIVGGAGNESLQVTELGMFTIDGGAGTNLLAISKSGQNSIADDDFSSVKQIQILRTNNSANDVELGTQANLAGIRTVVGGRLSDTFEISDSGYLSSLGSGKASIAGGAGNDILLVNGGVSLTDDIFAGLNGIEILSLTGNASVTLGANALAAGIQSVFGGAGNNVFTEASLGQFYISGGKGNDVLNLTLGGNAYLDSVFGSIGSIETVNLAAGDTATLGSYADAAHLQGVTGGSSIIDNTSAGLSTSVSSLSTSTSGVVSSLSTATGSLSTSTSGAASSLSTATGSLSTSASGVVSSLSTATGSLSTSTSGAVTSLSTSVGSLSTSTSGVVGSLSTSTSGVVS